MELLEDQSHPPLLDTLVIDLPGFGNSEMHVLWWDLTQKSGSPAGPGKTGTLLNAAAQNPTQH